MTLDLGLAARLVAGIRATTGAPAWDTAGIAAALRDVGGTPGAAFAAAALAAEDESLLKPSAAGFRAHWPKNAGVAGPRESANVRCHRHTLSFVPCPQCAAETGPTPPPESDPDYVAARARLKAEREAARLASSGGALPPVPVRDEASVDDARTRIPTEEVTPA